jgi:methionyl-tRNA formyltransferase
MKVLFWGTPPFAVASLRALDDEGFDIVGVVTQPDRPAGRGRRLQPSAVKEVALDQGFPVLTPDRPRGDDFMKEIRALEPDISVVVAYGHILLREVLDVPPLGSINVHASLLPELRGAAPINWAIARGHSKSGITIMRMVEALDAGPMLHCLQEPILHDETASELTARLSEVGAEALVEALALLTAGVIVEKPQDDDLATFAPKVERATARVNWSLPAVEVSRLIRAMDAVPGAWSEISGAPVKLYRPQVVPHHLVDPPRTPGAAGNGGPPPGALAPVPGQVVWADGERGILIAAGEGGVLVTEVQPPGKRRMSAQDWVNGRGVVSGQRFE